MGLESLMTKRQGFPASLADLQLTLIKRDTNFFLKSLSFGIVTVVSLPYLILMQCLFCTRPHSGHDSKQTRETRFLLLQDMLYKRRQIMNSDLLHSYGALQSTKYFHRHQLI